MAEYTDNAIAAAIGGYSAFRSGDPKAALLALAQGGSIEDLIWANLAQSDSAALQALLGNLLVEALKAEAYDEVMHTLLDLTRYNMAVEKNVVANLLDAIGLDPNAL